MCNSLFQVRAHKFTHVTAMESMFYRHNIIDKIMVDISRVVQEDTKIFIVDFYRNAPWEVVNSGVNRHLKLGYPLITAEEMSMVVANSPLEEVACEDFTENILRPCDIFAEEALKRDPEQKHLTYPMMRDAFYDKTLKMVAFTLRLSK